MSVDREKKVLLIAFHYPPCVGSSGMQRTLRFSQHLPQFGWQPLVLTIRPAAYESAAESRGNEVPAGLQVVRAFGLDAARHLSLFGRYPLSLALPDRWMSWQWDAIRRGVRLATQERVDAILSTYPIATAHVIGMAIAKRTGIPWVAEFRDPMWFVDYPPDRTMNAHWRALEQRIVAAASGIIVTTPGAVRFYVERYGEAVGRRMTVIENGYDEETFRRAEQSMPTATATVGQQRPLTLLHSGIIYRSERDPSQFFAALASLKRRGLIDADRLQVVLRASGSEGDYRAGVRGLGIDDIVRFEPAVDYLSALREMLTVDGLLVLQASNCNSQVPAKLYEYLRAGRPILALTDPAGDTARTLDRAGAGLVARLDCQPEIESALLEFMAQVDRRTARIASPETVRLNSRVARSQELARLLDALRPGT